ncbi:MAG TPA: CHAT domain-containing tetratricopeptide repeat protein, partial [Planctomycetota bacterium]|nr:CHAT domain-containing tetratricopeptide repeat protein [Planctomycetota bacterium]
SLGDPGKARSCFEKRVALAKESQDRPGEASAEARLGLLELSLDRLEEARNHYQRALDLRRASGSPTGEAWALVDLARVRRRAGEPKAAADAEAGALSLFQKAENREGETVVLGNLALTRKALRDPAEAEALCRRHLDLARGIGHRGEEIRGLGNLAALALDAGNLEVADESARQALAIAEETGAEEKGLPALQLLVRIAMSRGNPAAALASFERAERILERPSLRGLEIAEAAGVRSRFAAWGELRQDLAAFESSRPELDSGGRARSIAGGFRAAGLWKGRALLEGIVEHRAGGRSDDAIRIRKEWKEALAQRDAILERLARQVRAQAPREELESLREEARALLAKSEDRARLLREVSPADASLALPLGTDPEEVRGALVPRGTALLEFADGESRLYAYLLTQQDLLFVDLGDRASIDEAVGEFLALLSSPASLGSVAEVAAKGRALGDRLLPPALRAQASGFKRILVVPTASLSRLPFEALVLGTKGGAEPRRFEDVEFVLDRHEVCYGPATPVLVELASSWRPRAWGRVLVLADPVYAGDSGATPTVATGGGPPTRPAMPRLEKTRTEALAVAAHLIGKEERDARASLESLARRRGGSLKSAVLDLHLGSSANRALLQADLRPFSVLHLATHGYAGRDLPQRTGIVLAAEGGEDAYFALGDVLDLDLDANLVVLSACETARGDVRPGEGVESMARAFLYAGARGVVGSVWEVEDKAGAETMEAFYGRWFGKNLSPAEALHQSKLALRRSTQTRGVAGLASRAEAAPGLESGHPFFWAPFLYIGLPR